MRVDEACRDAGATARSRAPPARPSATRSGPCAAQVSLALRATGLLKINHDVVVPRGRVPELFDVVERAAGATYRPAHRLRSATPATATSTST